VNTKGKSLRQFMGKYHPVSSIRLSLKEFGEINGIKSVPLYAAYCI
jgi:hypothetical protein